MDWFLRPESVIDKFLVMVVAIVLFVAIMAPDPVAHRPPEGPDLGGGGRIPRPGHHRAGQSACSIRPLSTVVASFQVSSDRRWVQTAKPIINPDDRPTNSASWASAWPTTRRSSPTRTFQKVLINTVLWVILVPVLATVFGLIYAVLVDRTRFEKLAKALVFLPMAISMVGASIIWKFVYEYRQAGVNQIGLAEPDPGLARTRSVPIPHHRTLEHVLPDRRDDLDPGRLRHDACCPPRSRPCPTTSSRRLRSTAPPASSCSGRSRCRPFGPAVVVVITTIAMASLKAFDIVRTMTGGNFGTSVVANEFYTQSFRQGEAGQGIGAALAVDAVHHHHSGHRLQRPADAACRRKSDEHVAVLPIELPITDGLPTPEEALSSRQLKKQLRLQDAKTKLSSPWASGIAIVLAILWTIPTFGLFVTSFRPPADIADLGLVDVLRQSRHHLRATTPTPGQRQRRPRTASS